MAEDWRVTVTLPDATGVAPLLQVLHDHRADHELEVPAGERVAVSAADDRVIVYADTRWSAEAAEKVVGELAAEHGLEVDSQLDRWHPEEERWEDARVALPSTGAEHEAEHERREADEEADSEATGIADWDVRVEFRSHHEAVEFADRAEQNGQPVVRRWKFVLIGVNDEDEANELAAQLEQELPEGAVVHTEPGSGVAWEFTPSNRFAVFGGLAG
ncbi:MAG TPA: hypothetical protein VLV46_00370 [Gaiellaceae bacterium]|nr:hypothetical protein [Gaiellaceae bacterium]